MRAFAMVLGLSALVLGLHVLGYLNPTPANWGVHHYSFFPPAWLAAGAAAGLLVGLAAYLFRPGKSGPKMPAAVAVVAAALAGGTVFWWARATTHFLGDGWFWIEGLKRGRLLWHNEPGAIFGAYFLHQATGSTDPAHTFALVSVASGVIYLAMAVIFSRMAGEDAFGRVVSFGLLAFAGLTRLFYGYVETYPVFAAVAAIYLVLALAYVRGRGNAWILALVGTIAAAVHSTGLFLLPSLVFALIAAPRTEPTGAGRRLLPLAVPAAALAAGAGLAGSRVDLGSIYGNYLGKFLPLASAESVRFQYTLFSPAHFFDFLQEQLLLGPFAVLLVLVLLAAGGARTLGREGRLLLWAGIPWWIFSFFYNREIGAARDWDLFAVAAIPLAMAAGWMLARAPWRTQRPALAGLAGALVLGLTVFHTLPWVALGTDDERSVAHFAALYGPKSQASPFARGYAFEGIGTYYLDRGEVDNAEVAFREAVLADSTNGRVAGNLGSVLLATGRLEEGAEVLQSAIRREPGRAFLHYELGNAYREQGLREPARASYARALELNPDFLQAYINLSGLQLAETRLTEAQATLDAALTRFPRNHVLVANRGRLHQAQGDTAAAIAQYRAALEIYPDDTSSAFNLGLLLLNRGDAAGATAQFEMVVHRNPNDVEAWINLGVARGLTGNHDSSISAHARAIALNANRPEPYFNIFRTQMARGDTAAALNVMRAYAAVDSTSQYGQVARIFLRELSR